MTATTPKRESPPERYALVPDRVWDGTADGPETNAAVIVDGTLIDSIAPSSELPSGLPRVALDGCTLIPGLLDAHVHYSPVMGPALLAGGVTTIRDVGNDLEFIIEQRALNATDPTLGPSIRCCGHLHDGPVAYWARMGVSNADVETVRESVRAHAAAGVDAIKLYEGLPPDILTAAVDEGHRHGLFVTAHLGKTSAEEAAPVGVDGIEHLSRCDAAWRDATEEEDDALIDLLLEHNVALDPTLVVWDRLGRIMDHAFVHDRRREWVHPTHLHVWASYRSRPYMSKGRRRLQIASPHLKRFLGRAHERGVTVSLGTDTPFPHLVPGFSVHDELAMYVDAGIAPVDALRSATSVNARVFGVESTAGRIAPGMAADLVAVRGNPLERIDDMGNVETVVRTGRVLDRARLLESVRATFDEEPGDAITQDLLYIIEHGPRRGSGQEGRAERS